MVVNSTYVVDNTTKIINFDIDYLMIVIIVN